MRANATPNYPMSSFLPIQPLQRFMPGEAKRAAFSSSRQNQAMDALSRINANLQRQLGLENADRNIFEIFLGKIVSADYVEEAFGVSVNEMTDARYWVTRCKPAPTSKNDDLLDVQEDAFHEEEDAFVNATNLTEIPASSHSLEEDGDGVYLIFGVTADANKKELVRSYFFASGGTSGLLVKITGSASGGGKYTGKILTAPDALTTGSNNLAESDLGTEPDDDDALVLNTREVGKSTHDLEASGYLPLVFPVVKDLGTNSDGMRVLVIDGRQSDNC